MSFIPDSSGAKLEDLNHLDTMRKARSFGNCSCITLITYIHVGIDFAQDDNVLIQNHYNLYFQK